MDVNPGIRVSVVPAQSAFFAGESFLVSVTFTNVRSPDSPVKRATSHSHKRAVHSISSAPLARPPTSPVTPRTAVPPILTSAREANKTRTKHERKGLIGPGSTDDSSSTGTVSRTAEQWRGKSLSATLSSRDLAAALSSSGTSPLRNASLPANHPHARKQSVQDATLETQLQLKELSSPAPPGSASTSAFSLSLDTISENNADTHQYPPRRRPPNLGLGLGPPPRIAAEHQPPHTAFSSTFVQSGAELVLYAYAQLSGMVMLGTDSSQGESLTRTQALNAVRYALQKKQAFGGGRMDISSSLDGRPGEPSTRHNRSNGHARAASLSSGLMSLLSPPTSSHQPWTPSHKTGSPSLIASLISPSVSSPASIGSRSGTDSFEEVPPDTPLPTFEVQPVMLAVDLVLAPGQSRSYTYSLPLPATLPPTYRGRGVKFSYHLTVGVCRANPSPSSSSSNSRSSTSQVMRVPIRIYSHVDVSGIQRPYDLLWPISHPPGKEWTGHVSEASYGHTATNIPVRRSTMSSPLEAPNLPDAGVDRVAELRNYALRLLDSVSGHDIDLAGQSAETKALSPTIEGQYSVRGYGGGELTGCREAVEILTRNMRKVSYDVNKDGIKVAVLTFTKSAYRLGETVVGIVELNEISSRARVLKLSAMLEAHETFPSSLDPSAQGSRKLRKLHAEYHTSLTLSTLRTSFSLDIPSDAAPAFQYACAPPFSSKEERTGDGRPGGLAWTVRLCLLVCVTSPHAKKGVIGARMKGLLRDGPHGEWGTAWRPTRGIAPLQNIDARAARRAQQREALSATMKAQQTQQQRGWASYFLSGLLTPGEREYHDGDEDLDDSDLDDAPVLNGAYNASEGAFDETRTVSEGMDVDIDLGGGDEGWSELRAETVECEVPIRVWPGNTAFRPMEVVFDV